MSGAKVEGSPLLPPHDSRADDREAGGGDWRLPAAAVLLMVGYFAGSRLGFALTFQPRAVSVLWPPNAVLLGALLLAPRRVWPLFILAVLPAHFAVQLGGGVPLPMVVCWYVSNVFEASLGAFVVRRFADEPFRLGSFGALVVFCAGAVLFAPFASSFVDAAFVELNQWGDSSYWENWTMRFFSNVIAVLTVTTAIVCWYEAIDKSFWHRITASRALEAVVLVTCLVGVSVLAFTLPEARYSAQPVFVFAAFPLLLWAAVRFGPAGSSACMLIVAFLAIWGAAHGWGPFGDHVGTANTRIVQSFLFVVALPILAIAVILRQACENGEAAQSNEERLMLAADAAQMRTWDWDCQTDCMSWSIPAGHGRKRIETTSRREFLDRVHPEERSALSLAMDDAVRSDGSFQHEFRIEGPGDSESSWLMMKGRVRSGQTGEARVFGIVLDTTERNQAELQTRELREELSHMNRVALLGELTGAMAHELNQPLTAILSNAEAGKFILAREPKLPASIDEILGDIVMQGRRAADVIRSLRTLLQKERAELRPVDLNALVRETVDLEKSALITRKVAAVLELSTHVPAITADPVQLQQVLLNLIVNAYQAMAKQESRQRRLIVSTANEEGGVHLRIRDTGPGIPSEKIESVFEPFVTTKPGGLGLGLAICRSIALAHGGSLGAFNHDEGGAVFELVLPVT